MRAHYLQHVPFEGLGNIEPWLRLSGYGITNTQFFESTEVFHWHGETFDLPPGATLIARSESCENQAFQIGTSVIGLQFHLETTPESAREIVSNCSDELIPSQYVQTEEEILSVKSESYNSINQMMGNVLSCLSGKMKSIDKDT